LYLHTLDVVQAAILSKEQNGCQIENAASDEHWESRKRKLKAKNGFVAYASGIK